MEGEVYFPLECGQVVSFPLPALFQLSSSSRPFVYVCLSHPLPPPRPPPFLPPSSLVPISWCMFRACLCVGVCFRACFWLRVLSACSPVCLLPLCEPVLRHGRMFSGCMDSQTSADVQDVSKFGLPNADGAGGACTNAMLLTLVSAVGAGAAILPMLLAC